ncbi:hypothetical protein V5N11_010868 [Cardamine amara subsp. amara]|uniref:Uncharacterized protein n=1 Tax=Cardamine amara subsp. amara TaxID=228776 RepID=A0ABD1C1F3_CARAN
MKRQRIEMEEEETDQSLATAAMEVAVAAAAAKAAEEEEQWWGGGVEEEMTWSTVWLPFWDVEFVGRNYSVLFSDVVWDDDIWNLKDLTHDSSESFSFPIVP